jgi:ParB family transcriptional regulator, chromosome partitioning protein
MNTKKRALGRGLSALLDNSENEKLEQDMGEISIAGSVANILIDHIEVNPFQPRNHFDETALKDLSNSIKEQGIIQPVTVRRTDKGKYQLISGERRLKAAVMAGLRDIPAYIRIADDGAMLEMALVENIQRENLNAMEISLSYQQLIDDYNLTQEQLSERLGKNRSTITNYLRLLKLPAEIQVAIRQDKITMGHARALININDIKKQLSLYHKIIEKNLSVRNVEELVRKASESVKKDADPKTAAMVLLPPKYQRIKENITKAMGVNVDLKRNTNGKGNIIIPFVSDEELDSILHKLSLPK